MISDTTLMTKVMSRLRSEMNGAVAGSMAGGGLSYGLNYGVAAHTIRSVAREFAPNHSLAKLLFRQGVRELKIAALYIADPLQIECSQLDFWASGITTTEIAEHAGQMIGKSDAAWEIYKTWSESGDNLLIYSALLAAVSRIGAGRGVGVEFETVAESILAAARMQHNYLWRAAVSLIERIDRSLPDHRGDIAQLRTTLSNLSCEGAQHILTELDWMLAG